VIEIAAALAIASIVVACGSHDGHPSATAMPLAPGLEVRAEHGRKGVDKGGFDEVLVTGHRAQASRVILQRETQFLRRSGWKVGNRRRNGGRATRSHDGGVGGEVGYRSCFPELRRPLNAQSVPFFCESIASN
jgi:hypothetical protein